MKIKHLLRTPLIENYLKDYLAKYNLEVKKAQDLYYLMKDCEESLEKIRRRVNRLEVYLLNISQELLSKDKED